MHKSAIFCAILLLAVVISNSACRHPERPPNILLIMADDQGFGDYGTSGNPHIRTPNLDRLSEQSVSFENFYVSPVCAPTRASLLTGRYHQRTGVRSVTNGHEAMDPEEVTLAEILSAAGYRTGLFGKWHLGEYYPGLPNAQGFQEYVGFLTGHTAQYFDPELEHNGRPVLFKGYITDILTDEAIRFIEADKNRPFFCYLPYNAPHTPLQVPESYLTPYLDKGLDERTSRVYAMIENIDYNVGRLLAHLDKLGLTERTIVLYLSDNGPISGWQPRPEEMRYNAGLRGQKFTIYEGGVRTQCFMRWPENFSPGLCLDHITAHIDILPTLLDLVDVIAPHGVTIDGRSLVPLLDGQTTVWMDRTLFMNYSLETLDVPAPYPGGFVRSQRYKMVNGEFLYDLEQDPGETNNIAREQPALLKQMDRAYRAWWQTVTAERGFDRRPIPVGYEDENPVIIQPHHGKVKGGLEFVGFRGLLGHERIGTHPTGVDGDWITQWKSAEDEIQWEIDVVFPGLYRVILDVSCPDEQAGSVIEVQIGTRSLTGRVPAAPLESGKWKAFPVGEVELNTGKQVLSVRALDVARESVMDLGHVLLIRIQ